MDEDKLEQLQESQITEMLNSEGWKLARERLLTDCEVLESVRTLPSGTNAEIGEEAKVRSAAIGLVIGWIDQLESIKEAKLQDIEGNQPDYIRSY